MFNTEFFKLQWNTLNGSFGICGNAYMKPAFEKFKLNLSEFPRRKQGCIEK